MPIASWPEERGSRGRDQRRRRSGAAARSGSRYLGGSLRHGTRRGRTDVVSVMAFLRISSSISKPCLILVHGSIWVKLPSQQWAANGDRRSQVGRRHAAGGSWIPKPWYPDDIATHRLGQEVFETNAGFIERKGAMYPLSLSLRPGRQPEGERVDPNCTVPDCRV